MTQSNSLNAIKSFVDISHWNITGNITAEIGNWINSAMALSRNIAYIHMAELDITRCKLVLAREFPAALATYQHYGTWSKSTGRSKSSKDLVMQYEKFLIFTLNLNTIFWHCKTIAVTFEQGCALHFWFHWLLDLLWVCYDRFLFHFLLGVVLLHLLLRLLMLVTNGTVVKM